jgi:alkaline phosphatase D
MKILTFVSLLVAIFACQPKSSLPKLDDPLSDLLDPSLKPFYYGVASGDPLQDAVIIWTKVSPDDSVAQLTVSWELASDSKFTKVIAGGDFITDPDRGYTVKVDVKGLDAGTRYFYRFNYDGAYSPVGRTMTATGQVTDSVKFAVVSCSNYEFGPFNAYGALAERDDINAVLHLGDYIYEYGEKGYGDTTTGRFHLPPYEILSLSDYRTRYGQYRLDKDLMEAHQKHPFITIWDDHEIANDAYKDGAENHQPGEEGPYDTRRKIARKVYYEWMPVRPSENLYRKFDFGEMVDLIMLDERLAGRTAPVDSVTDPSIANEDRAMLGEPQLTWFHDQLKSSQSTWKVIGNQVIFSYLNWGFPTFSINLDSWDGYPGERAKIIQNIKENGIKNVVFVTGDTHSSWALEVTDDPFDSYDKEGAVAVEFGTTSINSGNTNERTGITDSMVIAHEKSIMGAPKNPQLKFTNMRDHGYLELALFKQHAITRWYYTPDRTIPSREMILAMEKITPLNSNQILDVE